jgi:hypothetical protein
MKVAVFSMKAYDREFLGAAKIPKGQNPANQSPSKKHLTYHRGV